MKYESCDICFARICYMCLNIRYCHVQNITQRWWYCRPCMEGQSKWRMLLIRDFSEGIPNQARFKINRASRAASTSADHRYRLSNSWWSGLIDMRTLVIACTKKALSARIHDDLQVWFWKLNHFCGLGIIRVRFICDRLQNTFKSYPQTSF